MHKSIYYYGSSSIRKSNENVFAQSFVHNTNLCSLNTFNVLISSFTMPLHEARLRLRSRSSTSLHTLLQSSSTQKCLYSMLLQLLPHCSLPVKMKTFHGGRTSVLISKVLNLKCSCLRAHLCVCVDIRWNFVNIVLSRVKWRRTNVKIRIFSRWMFLDV